MLGRAGNCGTWLGLHVGDASGLGWKVMETPSSRQGYSRGRGPPCSDLRPAGETLLPQRGLVPPCSHRACGAGGSVWGGSRGDFRGVPFRGQVERGPGWLL